MQLPNDTALRTPDLTVISASAGSGKTHTLTLRLLQLLLSSRIPLNRLRNILAITFTNNAAAEMRDRIFEYLKRGALGDDDTLVELAGVVHEERDVLVQRCTGAIETILADYSAFQVQTIDSFLTRVFRASALEFGLSPGVEVVLDNRPMLDRAFEDFTRTLAEDPVRRDLLVRLSDLLLESRRSGTRYVWDPFRILSREVRDLYDALSAQPKDILGHADLVPNLRTAEEEIRAACADVQDLIRQSGLEANGLVVHALDGARSGPIDGLLGVKSLFNAPLKRSGPNARARQAVEEWNARCAPVQARVKELLRAYIVLRARTHYEPFIQAYRVFHVSVESVARRAGQISLSEVNRALVRSMDARVVPQVYLYLGDSIAHFLIDEFQDTAPVQWQAIRPLVEEALAKHGSLFVVGDTKQSIYAFRHADWRIMHRLSAGEEFASVRPSVLELETNFRSGGRLVAFTTKLFRERIPGIVGREVVSASGLSAAAPQVRPGREQEGYVDVACFDRDDGPLPQREKLIGIVRDCVQRGYRFGEITVLTPKNEHVVAVSGWLNAASIPFVSHSSLDIRKRPVVGDLLALLRFLASPVDDLSFAAFVLGGTFRRALEAAPTDVLPQDVRSFLLEHARAGPGRLPLYVRFREAYPQAWSKWFEELLQVTGYLPMYDLVCRILRQFRLFAVWPDEEAALTRFLEAVIAFEELGANDLAEFLASADAEEDDGTWSIDAPKGLDAVHIMTVHKAKGLDNRVVIVLLADSRRWPDNRFFDEEEAGVELVHIRKAWTEHDDHLKSVYDRETFNRTVDALNSLYVALTRAKEEMYILSIASKRSPDTSRFFPGNETRGVRKTAEPLEAPSPPVAPVHHPTAELPRERPGSGQIGVTERHRGEALHAVLAKITSAAEGTEDQVRRWFAEVCDNYPDVTVTPDLVHKVTAFLELPSVRPFFELREGRRVLSEQEFVTAAGELRRMDRVIVDRDRVTVIDYKTGDDDPGYDEQVREYMEILRGLYPGVSIQGVLAFIDRQRTREVV